MTKFVEARETLEDGVKALIEGVIEDFTEWSTDNLTQMYESEGRVPHSELFKRTEGSLLQDFIRGMDYSKGLKYIKVTSDRGRVLCFIVATPKDDKFNIGDVLMPATWARPSRNKARGNVLTTGTNIRWTGPLYLR